MNSLPLPGCSPIPLAHYLKALGVLRLISENEQHGDPQTAGCWERDAFVLHSKFDREGLIQFFLQHYSPTPILAPWNGGSGFYFQEEKLKEKDPATGKRLQRCETFKSQSEANRRLREIALAKDAGASLASDTTPFGAWLDIWLKDWVRVDASTLRSYRSKVRVIQRSPLGQVRLGHLRLEHFQQWYRGLEAAHKAPGTIRGYAQLIGAAVNQAVHWIYPEKEVNPGHSSNMAIFGQKDD